MRGGVYLPMKIVLLSALVGAVVATAATLGVQKLVKPVDTSREILTVRGVQIIDSHGVVRARLGVKSMGDIEVPDLQLVSSNRRSPGIEMSLDREESGMMAFSSERIDGKLLLGHFHVGDDGPCSEEECGVWGLRILNHQHLPASPSELFFVAGNDGNAEATQAKYQANSSHIHPVQVQAVPELIRKSETAR